MHSFLLHRPSGMCPRDLISRICILLLASNTLIAFFSGCSNNNQKKERAAVGKNSTDTSKTPGVSEQEVRYSMDTGTINKLALKLKENPTPKTSKEVEAEIKKPAIFIRDYLQDNPRTPEGAAALALIATIYRTIDSKIGKQNKQITKTYKLIIRLYPDSPEALDARNWLDQH